MMKRICLTCFGAFELRDMRGGRCLAHARANDRARNARRGDEYRFYGSAAWKSLAAETLANAFGCHWCHRLDVKLTADHVATVRHRPDLALEPDNVVAACRSCQVRRQYQPGGGRGAV